MSTGAEKRITVVVGNGFTEVALRQNRLPYTALYHAIPDPPKTYLFRVPYYGFLV